MLRRYSGLIGVVLRALDVVVVAAAWICAYDLRFRLLPMVTPSEIPSFQRYAALTPLIAALWLVVFSARGLYSSRRLTSLAREWQDIFKAQVVALAAFVSMTYFFEDYKYSRLTIGYFALLSSVGLGGARTALRLLMRELRARGYNIRHVLVVGAEDNARRVLHQIEGYPELGLRVLGVVKGRAGSDASEVDGYPVLGDLDDLPSVLTTRTGIDEVVVALSGQEQHLVDPVLRALRDEVVGVRVIPDVQAYATLGCTLDELGSLPVLRINDSPLQGWGAPAKRLLDVTGALVALLVFSPLMVAIALLVRASSKGPILYGQERMGLDGRTFKMLKFRSMKVDAERTSGAVWAQAQDDRRTPIGTFLRRTSLDELPQLWNVLVGDMSLVGPRPERPVFVQRFRSEIPHYMLRHKVKAGITGWAQVNGWRGNTSLDRRIECDLFYIKHWSLAFDLRILLMTFWKGFVNENAY